MRLIDADALLRRYDEEHEGPPGNARTLIEEAPTACGWISVKDDLPKEFGEPCIVYNGSSVQYGDYYSNGEWYTPDCYESEEIRGVTHWMPLPEQPKEENSGNFRYGVLSNVRANLAKMPTVCGWIRVKDRLPKSMINKVLVWLKHEDLNSYIGYGHYEKFHGEEMWYDLEHNERFDKRGYIVTHWMPLPEPPKEESDD